MMRLILAFIQNIVGTQKALLASNEYLPHAFMKKYSKLSANYYKIPTLITVNRLIFPPINFRLFVLSDIFAAINFSGLQSWTMQDQFTV